VSSTVFVVETPKSWQAGPLNIRPRTGPGSDPAKAHRERLTTDRIVDEALEQMREVGYDGVTMRSIARALDTGPASLYAHVANREELDQLVVDRIASEVRIPEPDPDRWDEQIKEMMRAALTTYRAYPGAARATMAIIPTGYGALRNAEGLMALCRAGNVPDQAAAWFGDLISLYIGAVAVEEAIWSERAKVHADADPERVVAAVTSYFAELPADEFPMLSSLASVMTAGVGDDRFEFGLAVLVAGLKSYSETARVAESEAGGR